MTKTLHRTQVLIIGSGPAGYTAGVYAARAMLEPILVQGSQAGGQLTITSEVENYPPFVEITGPKLMEDMEHHARAAGVTVIADHIASLDVNLSPFVAEGESGDSYAADAIILATGAQARWLGLDSETRYMGRGVSACAVCDGFFFRGKRVVVIGGGNTAVEEALFLTRFASEVLLVHRRDTLRADAILQRRLSENPKITCVWHSVAEEILGDEKNEMVTGIRLRDVRSGDITEIPCDGIFVAIGHSPSSQLVASSLAVDDAGYVITAPDSTVTSVPGIFAAGDITDRIYRQAITSAGMGCMAALEAEQWLAQKALDNDD